jgi:hypothetical protein
MPFENFFTIPWLRRYRLAAIAVLLSAISVRCGGEKVGPRPEPSVIEMASGNGQVAPVNDELPQPLVVRVTDEAGDPAEGVTVQWDALGGGNVSPATVVTDAAGLAAVSRLLGDTPGQQTTAASVTGLQGSPVTFTATATDGTTPTLAIATQPSPVAQSGVVLPVQPVIQLKDGAGADKAQSGVVVTAALTGAAGTLGGDVTRATDGTGATDFDDLAVTGADGDYTITFTAPGYVQVISATITLGTPSLALNTQPSADAVSGTALAQQPVVQLVAGAGADDAQSGIVVTAALVAGGTATLGGDLTKTTGAGGSAAFTDLVITGDPGDYTLRFTAPGYAAVTSSTVALSAAPSTIALTTNPPTAALTGEVWDPSVQPEVLVQDGNGQPAPGVVVTASIASGGGTLEGDVTATTDATGHARFGDLGISGNNNQTVRFAIETDTVTAAPVDLSPLPIEATKGEWGPVVNWDIVPLHLSLLPTGSLLGWGRLEMNGSMGMPRLWDPSSGAPSSAPMVPVDTMLFCSGHAFLADGRLLISGGHKADGKGLDITTIFDPASESFIQNLPKMAHGRWYPTVTELPDGRMLTMAGQDSAGNVVTTPEIWEGNLWVELPGAGALQIPYYPRNFIDPTNGLVFMASERIRSRWFDVDGSTGSGRGRWINGPFHIWANNREYGSAVMYETGRILVVGGGGDPTWNTPDAKSSVPTATAEKINLNAGSPVWQSAGSMSTPRRHMNATILPDGEVLVTGGTSGGGFVDLNPADATREAEVWNPATNGWTTLAANSVMRTYHSVSLLLPDGTVLHGASGNAFVGAVAMPDENSHEIFRPPYLFKGARPTITTAPANVNAGQTFTVTTPNGAQVTEVRWIHIGSVTHAFDAGQRANTLSFTRTATGVSVTVPGSSNDATPGHYMVFILNRNGVPSKGRMIRLN